MSVVAGGHRLETRWIGPPPDEAPTIVFLHAGLGCVSSWRSFPDALVRATGCGGLLYSRFGYGKSDPVEPPRPLTYMHDEARITLPEVLSQFAIRHCILYGHSDGGSIALIHAATPPSRPRVQGLILEAAHVFCEEVSVTSIERDREAFLHGDLRERLRRHHGDNTDGAFWGWNRAWLDPAFRAWNLEDLLPSIQVPTLVVQGEDDPYGTMRQVEAIERGVRAPVETFIVPKCGHAPHREAEAEMLARSAQFVTRVLGAAP